MALREKKHHDFSEKHYKKVLKKNDPFDQLILHLAKTGMLDVTIVGFYDKRKHQPSHEYFKKFFPRYGKHTS